MSVTQPGMPENVTQKRVIDFFTDTLGYEYLGNWHHRDGNSNVEVEWLRKFLESRRPKYSEAEIKKAIDQIVKTARLPGAGKLYVANEKFYSLLRYGTKVKVGVGAKHKTVHLIDWKNPEKNHFAVAEEVTVKGVHDKRPDLVLYVNGIALAVLELKRSTVPVEEAIHQNLDNQKPIFIEHFFTTVQLVLAGHDTQGLRYGTVGTPLRRFLEWKEEHDDYAHDNGLFPLDNDLRCLCTKERFLDFIHHFVAFHRGVKKTCRPNQYFGVKAAQVAIRKRLGGIIWHTQGSGKSLTMIWLAKWILENFADGRVLIMTDRTELDEQIRNDFISVGEKDIHRMRSSADLLVQLQKSAPRLLCSLIHKTRGYETDEDIDAFVRELKQGDGDTFRPRGNIFVFVDECHRTQSGKLHEAMKRILPNALFIGFTGTPLIKTERKTTVDTFGDFLHIYRYNDAVRDGVVLDLRYEARHIEQDVVGKDQIDIWFDAKTRGLSDFGKNILKQRWATLKKIFSSKERLERIVGDIMLDFETKDRLQSGRGNALLVAGSIYEACKFYEIFQAKGFSQCAIVSSYDPSIGNIRGEESGEGRTEDIKKYEVYMRMIGDMSSEEFEKEAKRQFVKEPDRMKLLIVVDKLLTGFDAPAATYLYIDKQMRNHGLFQAICRVNRLHDVKDEDGRDINDKEFGYIVDYKDLWHSLDAAMTDYTGGAFEEYEKEDVQGIFRDRLIAAKDRLDTALDQIHALCEGVEPPGGTMDYVRFFKPPTDATEEEAKKKERRRLLLYKYTASLQRAFADIASEMTPAGYSKDEERQIREEVQRFEAIRQEVKIASSDYVDLKVFEPGMRHLIDTYIKAGMTEVISRFDDLTLVDMLAEDPQKAIDSLPDGIRGSHEAVAETIDANLRKVIIEERPTNPKYYDEMSRLLDELLARLRRAALDYKKELAEIAELARKIKRPETGGGYPRTVRSKGQRALYDNLDRNEELALEIDADVLQNRPDNWTEDGMKRRHVERLLNKHLPDDRELRQRIFGIVLENYKNG